MFSLIITIVSIALTVLLAIATVYYGSSVYNNWKASANAATLTNQASQIYAAAQLYYNDTQRWPTSASQLQPNYLTNIPLPPNSALTTTVSTLITTLFAQATPTLEWSLVLDDQDILTYLAVKNLIAPDTCKAIKNSSDGSTSVFVNVSYEAAVKEITDSVDLMIERQEIQITDYLPDYDGVSTLSDNQKKRIAKMAIIPTIIDPAKIYQCVDQGLSVSDETGTSAFTYFWMTPSGGNACSAITLFNANGNQANLSCGCSGGKILNSQGECVTNTGPVTPPSNTLALVPAQLNFGNVLINQYGLDYFTLQNNTEQTQELANIDWDGEMFDVYSDCSVTMAPASSCLIWMAFLPETTGLQQGMLRVQGVSGTLVQGAYSGTGITETSTPPVSPDPATPQETFCEQHPDDPKCFVVDTNTLDCIVDPTQPGCIWETDQLNPQYCSARWGCVNDIASDGELIKVAASENILAAYLAAELAVHDQNQDLQAIYGLAYQPFNNYKIQFGTPYWDVDVNSVTMSRLGQSKSLNDGMILGITYTDNWDTASLSTITPYVEFADMAMPANLIPDWNPASLLPPWRAYEYPLIPSHMTNGFVVSSLTTGVPYRLVAKGTASNAKGKLIQWEHTNFVHTIPKSLVAYDQPNPIEGIFRIEGDVGTFLTIAPQYAWSDMVIPANGGTYAAYSSDMDLIGQGVPVAYAGATSNTPDVMEQTQICEEIFNVAKAQAVNAMTNWMLFDDDHTISVAYLDTTNAIAPVLECLFMGAKAGGLNYTVDLVPCQNPVSYGSQAGCFLQTQATNEITGLPKEHRIIAEGHVYVMPDPIIYSVVNSAGHPIVAISNGTLPGPVQWSPAQPTLGVRNWIEYGEIITITGKNFYQPTVSYQDNPSNVEVISHIKLANGFDQLQIKLLPHFDAYGTLMIRNNEHVLRNIQDYWDNWAWMHDWYWQSRLIWSQIGRPGEDKMPVTMAPPKISLNSITRNADRSLTITGTNMTGLAYLELGYSSVVDYANRLNFPADYLQITATTVTIPTELVISYALENQPSIWFQASTSPYPNTDDEIEVFKYLSNPIFLHETVTPPPPVVIPTKTTSAGAKSPLAPVKQASVPISKPTVNPTTTFTLVAYAPGVSTIPYAGTGATVTSFCNVMPSNVQGRLVIPDGWNWDMSGGTPKRFETNNASLPFLASLSQYGRAGVGGMPGGLYFQCIGIPSAKNTTCTNGTLQAGGSFIYTCSTH